MGLSFLLRISVLSRALAGEQLVERRRRVVRGTLGAVVARAVLLRPHRVVLGPASEELIVRTVFDNLAIL